MKGWFSMPITISDNIDIFGIKIIISIYLEIKEN